MIKDSRSGHPDTFRIEEKEEGEKEYRQVEVEQQ